MALNRSALRKPVNNQVVDPSTGVMREEWQNYFSVLTGQLNQAVGELSTDDAPADAEYIVGALSSGLSAERLLSSSTSITADLATPGAASLTRAALTGDVTASANSNATTIANSAVTLAKMADLSQGTIIGRAAAAGTGVPQALTSAQATAILDAFTSGAKGLAPASGGGTVNVLRADGTWAPSALSLVQTNSFTTASTTDFTTIPSNTAWLLFTGYITAYSTDGALTLARYSQSGSFLTGASDYAYASPGAAVAGGPSGVGAASASSIQIVNGTDQAGYSEFACNVWRPLGTGRKLLEGRSIAVNGAGTLIYQLVSGVLAANANAIDGVRFLPSAGTFTGAISMYAAIPAT